MEHQNCQYLKDSLSEYIDGTLSADLCAEIEQHMQECENCKIVVDSLRKTIYLYRTSAESEVIPEDVLERLYARLEIKEFSGQKIE